MAKPELIAELKTANNQAGVRAVLIKLNSLANYRFTALYYFDGDINRRLYFYDRQNPTVESAADFEDLPVTATYCVYVREFGIPFVIEDSLRDDRVTAHPAKHNVRAYCGVPLVDCNGNPFATLCHFDFYPILDDVEHIELMHSLAEVLQGQCGLIPKPR